MEDKWEFEEEETSDGQMFSAYDEHGDRLTAPFISEKNAKRIAAAPEVLDALVELMKYQSRADPDINEEYAAVLNTCDEAIAKATASEGTV